MRDLIVDVVGIVGAGLIAYGAWLIYQPAGAIVAGALLLTGAWLFSSRAD